MDLVFLIFVSVSGVILFLAVQQSKIKKQIEENRRKFDDPALPGSGAADPTTPNLLVDLPPPGPSTPHSPDAGGHHGGHDGGGGFDGGGGHH